jgi:hypothetical protein
MHLAKLLALASGVSCVAVYSHAQSIKVEVRDDGQPVAVLVQGQTEPTTDPTFNAGAPIEFTLPSFAGVLTVRVFDTTLVNNRPDEAVGTVIIHGGPTTLGTSRMDFLLSGTGAFPTNPRDIMENRGAASFGTGTAPALTITNEALRRRTRVAIAVLGDIRGDITAGQIFRIQAGIPADFDRAEFSGDVSTTITAIGRDRERIAGADPLKAIASSAL